MKNFIQPGLTLDLIAPADVVSGGRLLVGASILAFAQANKVSGETFAGLVEGVVEADKLTADAMVVGVKVNWNDATKEFQLVTSTLDSAATVVEAAGAGKTKVKVKLTPV